MTKYKYKIMCHAHRDYALHNMATLFNNHPRPTLVAVNLVPTDVPQSTKTSDQIMHRMKPTYYNYVSVGGAPEAYGM